MTEPTEEARAEMDAINKGRADAGFLPLWGSSAKAAILALSPAEVVKGLTDAENQ